MDLDAIRKRDSDFVQAEWEPADGSHEEHPETWCQADRDRHDLLAEIDDMQAVFDLRYRADMRAIAAWEKEHPDRPLTWPDHADLVVFLAKRLMEQDKVIEQALVVANVNAKWRQWSNAMQNLRDLLAATEKA